MSALANWFKGLFYRFNWYWYVRQAYERNWKWTCRVCRKPYSTIVAPNKAFRRGICPDCCTHPDYEHIPREGYQCVECGQEAPYGYGLYDC